MASPRNCQTSPKFHAVVFGSSGIAGQALLRQLAARQEFAKVVLILRKPLPLPPPSWSSVDDTNGVNWDKFKVVVVPDVGDVSSYADHLSGISIAFYTLGSKWKLVSRQEFEAVEVTLLQKLGQGLLDLSDITEFHFLSATNTSSYSLNPISRIKAQAERILGGLGFSRLVIYRPGYFLVPNPETGELSTGDWIMSTWLDPWRWISLDISLLAGVMVGTALEEYRQKKGTRNTRILEHAEIDGDGAENSDFVIVGSSILLELNLSTNSEALSREVPSSGMWTGQSSLKSTATDVVANRSGKAQEMYDCYSDSDVEDEDDSDLDLDLVREAHPALSNHDVVEYILSFIASAEDLKNCRLVSKMWSEVAARPLGQKTLFFISRLPELDYTNEVFTSFPSCLVRCIEFYVDWVDKLNYLTFLINHQKDIECVRFILTIGDASRGRFFPGISNVLGRLHYPHLKKLVLQEPSEAPLQLGPFPEDTCFADFIERLQHKNPPINIDLNFKSLRSLNISVSSDSLGQTNRKNYDTFQLLIDHCPNLEELEIMGNFYPDLKAAAKLKSLVWVGPKIEFDQSRNIVFATTDFSLSKLIDMLEGVAEVLENLTLGSTTEVESEQRYVRGIVDGVVETERVNDLRDVRCELYPRMPKLTNLFVSEVNLFAISSESLTQERLPSLKNVTLKSTQINEFPIKILDSQNLIVGSKYLSISPVPTGVSDIWKEVATIFPNLRKLSVGCTSYYKDDPPTPAAVFMKNTLNLIGFLLPTLEELSIHLKFSCTLEELMNAIWAKGFRGKALQKLKIVASKKDVCIKGAGRCDNFREPFTLYKNLTLVGFLIEKDTRKRMMNFILKRKLNVNFFASDE